MDFSKLRLGLYDFFGILIPGLIVVADIWIASVGWARFIDTVAALSGNLVAVVILISYALGHLVQEAGDVLVSGITHNRYLKTSRDELWAGNDGKIVREEIKKREGLDVADVDTAFDYCLTKSKRSFEKRDAFIATSDLARSFVLLGIVTGVTASCAIYKAKSPGWSLIGYLLAVMALTVMVVFISWRRMVRFRAFSDKPVFAAYLATVKEPHEISKPALQSEP
jgi:hypothetical protein